MSCVGLKRATPRLEKLVTRAYSNFGFPFTKTKKKNKNWAKETVAKRVLVWILKLIFNQVMTGDAKEEEHKQFAD